MTTRTLTMPRLGETMEEGTIVGWLVTPGQSFQRGAAIIEIETDKTVVEYPALGDGVLDETLVAAGDRVVVGAPIARVTVAHAHDWENDASTTPASSWANPVAILAMPRLGETMEEGVIVRWLVAEGEAYARGQAILEIETDKTAAEVPALSAGRLVKILAAEGTRQSVGAPIAEIEGAVEAAASQPVLPGSSAAPALAKTGPACSADSRLRATPPARKLARQSGIALAAIQGTGRRGRIERRDVESAATALPGRSSSGRTSGRIAFDAVGQGAATFLLIHGFAGDRSTWASTASGLARAGHRAIVPDLPGHGATEAEAKNLDDLIDAMTDFTKTLHGPLHLVGHSLGAAVATGLATRLGAKATSLTLIAPAGTGQEIESKFILGMADAITAGEVATLLRFLGPKGDGLSDTALTAMAAQMARGRLKVLARALVGPQGQRIDILRELAKLTETMPVRALVGKDDRIIPASHALNLPSGVAVHFLAAGHMPHWDSPRETLSLLTGGLEAFRSRD